MVEFNILTYNTRGLRDKRKRIKIFNFLKSKQRCGILMMQESHSVESDHEQWQNELEGYKLYLNSGTSMARGTLFGISKNFDLQNIKYYDDGDGRLQILSGVHDDQKFLFINIYNFNYQSEQVKLLKTLNEKLTQFNQNLDHQIICGGDWNFVNDKTKDTYNCTQPPKLKSIAELTNITENHDLCEIFRIRNPDKKLYTFRANTPRRMSRLDFYMISNSLQESIGKCEILNSVSSDHNPVLLSIKSPYDSKKILHIGNLTLHSSKTMFSLRN